MAKTRQPVSEDQKRELVNAVNELAYQNNWNPTDILTAISFETKGTFNKAINGPVTQWGRHQGLIQWGGPQRERYNVDVNGPIRDQVRAIGEYLKDTGVKPGDGLMQIYAAINAGDAKKTGASDAKNGGTPGTVADKVQKQMTAHRDKAAAMFARYGSPASLSKTGTGYSLGPDTLAQPTLPPIDGLTRQAYYRDANFNPIATPSSRFSGLMTPVRPGIPERAPRQVSAAPTSDFRTLPPKTVPASATQFGPGPASRNQTPVLNPAAIQRMQDNLTSKMAFARPNPSNMNISGYGFSTPAKPAGPQATGSATGSIGRASAVGNAAVPSRAPGVLGGRGNINPPNVVAAPANNLPAFDESGRWTGGANLPQRSPTVSTWGAMANAPVVQAPSQQAALGPTNDPSVRAAQAALAERNRRDQFARDLIKSMPAPAPAIPNDPRAAAYGVAPGWGADAIDSPLSPAPQRQAAPVRQAVPNTPVAPSAPSIPNVPQTVAPRAPSVQAPAVNAPMTQQQRMDKALADMRVGIPPQDIYDQNAPGRSGFRGFGAGGFLGNLLTGNIGNMRGIEGGLQLPGLLGVLQNVVQGLGGPQQAAQAVQAAAPALGQVMGLPAAQQAAKAGNNMVIGRDAAGRIGWMADGALSAGAANAGWASNNPERNYGGYGGGYDPTPV